MSTTFFRQQEIARRNTTYLVVLFAVAVLGIIASFNALVYFFLKSKYAEYDPDGLLVSSHLEVKPYLYTTLAVLVIIAFGACVMSVVR